MAEVAGDATCLNAAIVANNNGQLPCNDVMTNPGCQAQVIGYIGQLCGASGTSQIPETISSSTQPKSDVQPDPTSIFFRSFLMEQQITNI